MIQPFFSIIIPTRNRYETLLYTVRTVMGQDFGSFELIVSDNSDPDNLSGVELIREYLHDERVRYCRPPSILSMSDNWEFAVSAAKGEFIIVLGDDDGLVSGSLAHIHAVLNKTKKDLVSWARVEYSWPDRTPPQFANLTVIPYMAKTGLVSGKDFMIKVMSCEADYRYFPMLYNSAVSRRLIDKLIAKTGRVFNSACPDIYTGYAFAHMEGSYITIGYPLSINGVSSKSNGAAHSTGKSAAQEDYWKTFRTSAIKWPREIPEINSPYLGIIEPYIQLSKFFPEISGYISRKEIYKIIVDSLESNSSQDLADKLEKILESAKDDSSLHKWLVDHIRKVDPRVGPAIPDGYENRVGFDGSHLVLDAAKFGLKNVHDVSIFIRDLFGNFKDSDYSNPVSQTFLKRIKKAAAMAWRGV